MYKLINMTPVQRAEALAEIAALYTLPDNYTGRIEIIDPNTSMIFWGTGEEYGRVIVNLIRYHGHIATVEINNGIARLHAV